MSVRVLKVRAHGHDQIRGLVHFGLLVGIAQKLANLFIHIVLVEIRIVHDGVVAAVLVPAEAGRRVVAVGQYAREYSRLLSQILAPLPQHLERFLARSVVLVLIVHSAQKQPVEPELRKQRRLFSRVAKRVDLPSITQEFQIIRIGFGADFKFTRQPGVSRKVQILFE